ncbi:MAG: autotransporter-associated beta strand repeat-containing protein [Pirellulales bacterium]
MTRQRRANRVILLAVAFAAFTAVLTTSPAHAADKYWVGTSANPTPTGTWSEAGTVWNTASDGSGSAAAWGAGDRAIFSAGTGATGTFTVTVSGTHSVSGVTVEEGTVTLLNGTLNFSDDSIIDVPTGLMMTLDSIMTNAAGEQLIKNGNGTVALGNANNTGFLGEFVLNTGTLGLGDNANCLGNTLGSSTFTINGGSISNGTGANRLLAANLTTNLDGNFSVNKSLDSDPSSTETVGFNGVATIHNSNRVITVDSDAILVIANTLGADIGSRTLTKQGTGTLRFETSLANAGSSFFGDITIPAGRLEVSSTGRIGNETNLIHFTGGSLNIQTSRTSITGDPIANPLSIEAATAITTTSASGTVNAAFTGTVTSTGGGSLTFRNDGADGANDTFDPRLSMGDATFSMPIAIDNGTTGKTRLTSANDSGTTHTFDGVISGSGSYRRLDNSNGTTNFTKANTYSGGTAVSGGTLLVNNPAGPGSGTGSGDVTVSSGGRLGGTGSIAGTVTVSGDMFSPGVVAPGNSVGTLTMGGLTLNSGTNNSRLSFELATPGASDLINVTNVDGLIINAARVDVFSLAGFGAGTYTLIDYAGTVGGAGLAGLTLGTNPGGGFNYNFFDTGSVIQLKVTTPGGVDGDYNDDGTVDAADFVMWRNNVGQPFGTLPHDSTGVTIGDAQYAQWRTNFGLSGGSSTALGQSPVPEPASAILLLIGLAGLCSRRRAA